MIRNKLKTNKQVSTARQHIAMDTYKIIILYCIAVLMIRSLTTSVHRAHREVITMCYLCFCSAADHPELHVTSSLYVFFVFAFNSRPSWIPCDVITTCVLCVAFHSRSSWTRYDVITICVLCFPSTADHPELHAQVPASYPHRAQEGHGPRKYRHPEPRRGGV